MIEQIMAILYLVMLARSRHLLVGDPLFHGLVMCFVDVARMDRVNETLNQVLQHAGGNKQATARVLAVDRKTLDRMVKRQRIPVTTGA